MKVFKEAHARSDVGKAVGGGAAGGGGAWGLMMRQLQRELPEVHFVALFFLRAPLRAAQGARKKRATKSKRVSCPRFLPLDYQAKATLSCDTHTWQKQHSEAHASSATTK
jgi:hypothetical protein